MPASAVVLASCRRKPARPARAEIVEEDAIAEDQLGPGGSPKHEVGADHAARGATLEVDAGKPIQRKLAMFYGALLRCE